MADNENAATDSKDGWQARARKWAKRVFGRDEELNDRDLGYGGYDGITVSMMLGSGKRAARSRVDIYTKWHFMSGDPIISSALRLHVTQALGGHETTGDTVFIEATPEAEKDKARKKLVEELNRDLAKLFNGVAHQVAFNGATFGDAYARVYAQPKVGLTALYTDELVHPPLVQPYERGGKTVGYVVSTGEKFLEKLTIKQMARLKMPRLLYVPQMRIIEKAAKVAIREDDPEALPVVPALIGGSFLDAAEEPYDNLQASLAGLIGSRIISSIDESMVSANLEGMTIEQRKEYMNALKDMLTKSKERAEKAQKENRPLLSRFFHIMPTFSEKQMATITQFQGTSGSQSYSVDDVLFHAKLLSGSLGIDLAMLGFADILSGGLGDGGFFRTSAQAAERSRIIRTALSQFFDDLIDIHTYNKYGWVFDDADRPYKINFYGSISALEAEKQASRERASNATGMLIQNLLQMKELGLDKEANKLILSKHMLLEDQIAQSLSAGLDKAKQEAKEQAMQEGGFGGGGGDGGGFGGGMGNEPPKDYDQPQKGLGGNDDADAGE